LGCATAGTQVENNNTTSDLWALEPIPDGMFKESSAGACDHYHIPESPSVIQTSLSRSGSLYLHGRKIATVASLQTGVHAGGRARQNNLQVELALVGHAALLTTATPRAE